jgi:hypothetical protein
MEVRAGQRSSTMLQAMAHNLSTIERDLEMLTPVLKARGQSAILGTLAEGHAHMTAAYESFLQCFVREIEAEILSGHDHPHSDDAEGTERVHIGPHAHELIEAEAAIAAERAAKYETR